MKLNQFHRIVVIGGHELTYFIEKKAYHLRDGIGLRDVQQGPMSFSIYIDQSRNDDFNQNYRNISLNPSLLSWGPSGSTLKFFL